MGDVMSSSAVPCGNVEFPLLNPLCFQLHGTRRSPCCRAGHSSKCHRRHRPAHSLHCWLTLVLDEASRQLKHRTLLPVAKTGLVLKGHMDFPAGRSLGIQVVDTDHRNDLSEGENQAKPRRISFQFHSPPPPAESKHRGLISIKTVTLCFS